VFFVKEIQKCCVMFVCRQSKRNGEATARRSVLKVRVKFSVFDKILLRIIVMCNTARLIGMFLITDVFK